MPRLISSEEAARRLGVKLPTLYAYVSRGLLASHRAEGGRRSVFELADIERLAARQRGGRRDESRLATITTGVTQLRADGPFYRGRAAVSLPGVLSFEEVASLLWECDPGGDWRDPGVGTCPLPSVAHAMQWALVMGAARDEQRSDLRPAAVQRAARRVVAAFVSVVGERPVDEDPADPIATRLARRLAGPPNDAPPGLTAAVDAALILMADHELATSTLAVRVAASTRADVYDALAAGLATLAGPLHGGASEQAHAMLVSAERDGAARAVNDLLRGNGRLPGFGHAIYKERDPRFDALLALTEPLLAVERTAVLHEVMELASAHKVPFANCDLALAALAWGAGLPADSGRTLFTVARIAGWTAHYQEELAERPLRFRVRALYNLAPEITTADA